MRFKFLHLISDVPFRNNCEHALIGFLKHLNALNMNWYCEHWAFPTTYQKKSVLQVINMQDKWARSFGKCAFCHSLFDSKILNTMKKPLKTATISVHWSNSIKYISISCNTFNLTLILYCYQFYFNLQSLTAHLYKNRNKKTVTKRGAILLLRSEISSKDSSERIVQMFYER